MFLSGGQFRILLDSRLIHAGMTVFGKEIRSTQQSCEGYDPQRFNRSDSAHFNLSSHRLIDKTVVESLFDISLLGLGMVDKFQGICHRLLDHSERAGKSGAVIFEAAL